MIEKLFLIFSNFIKSKTNWIAFPVQSQMRCPKPQANEKQNKTKFRWHKDIYDIMEYLKYKGTAVCTKPLLPIAWGAPAATFGLLRGVSAGWIGRMPDIGWGWVCPALGRWRGAIEVSMVGTGSVSLARERRVNFKVLRWRSKLLSFFH